MNVFITGTDTGVGKTYVTSLMLRSLVSEGRGAVGYKPICCGGREDAVELLDASSEGASVDEVDPVWLKTPASPQAASVIEGVEVDVASLVAGYEGLASRFGDVLVEGVGGWEVPLAPGVRVSDFAYDLGLPVVLVVDNRLGALNHTLLTLGAIRARGLDCVGVVLNHTADERDIASVSNRQILESHLEVPVLFEVLHGEDALDLEELGFMVGA